MPQTLTNQSLTEWEEKKMLHKKKMRLHLQPQNNCAC